MPNIHSSLSPEGESNRRKIFTAIFSFLVISVLFVLASCQPNRVEISVPPEDSSPKFYSAYGIQIQLPIKPLSKSVKDKAIVSSDVVIIDENGDKRFMTANELDALLRTVFAPKSEKEWWLMKCPNSKITWIDNSRYCSVFIDKPEDRGNDFIPSPERK